MKTKLSELKKAEDYATYSEYRKSRFNVGLGAMPESLYNALKADQIQESEK